MPRRLREASGGIVYHVLNRAVGRMKLFETEDDYAAFERVLEETYVRPQMHLLVPLPAAAGSVEVVSRDTLHIHNAGL